MFSGVKRCVQVCTRTVSRLGQDKALLLYVVDTGQVSAVFVTGSHCVLPDQLLVPLQVIAVACVRNPVTGAETGLPSGCTWKSKQGKDTSQQKIYILKNTDFFLVLVFSIYVVVLVDCWWSLYGKCNLFFCCRRCSPILRLFQCL